MHIPDGFISTRVAIAGIAVAADATTESILYDIPLLKAHGLAH